jgi:hypothetical protein
VIALSFHEQSELMKTSHGETIVNAIAAFAIVAP